LKVTPLKKRRKVGKQFARFREKNRLTQVELGKLIGLSKISICLIETFKKYPRYSTLARFEALVEKFKRGRELAKPPKRSVGRPRKTAGVAEEP
jgi:DNA-binding XRE family transcriptional regulator